MTKRDSNIELFRCIVMFLIVMHHYVMHSKLLDVMTTDIVSAKTIYLYLFSMWGKIGINCFVLITGYYMCMSHITVYKFLKLLFQIEFYKILFYVSFLILGYEHFSVISCLRNVLPISDISIGFVECYLLFYLFIPFLNILIHNMTKKQYICLLSLLLFIYSIWPQTSLFIVRSNYVVWFCVLYLLSAYMRIYETEYSLFTKPWGFYLMITVLIACFSVVYLVLQGNSDPYYFVMDCNKTLALIISVCAFLYFKGLKIKYNRWINIVGATTFGILLIHDNGWTMRYCVWQGALKTVDWYESNIYIHSILSVIAVFVICSIIDIFRKRYLERPLFEYFL